MNFQYSRSDGEYWDERIFADAIDPYAFRFSSCEGTTTPVRGVPCYDVDWLDPALMRGEGPQEAQDFLFGDETGQTIYTQFSADAVMSGDLFELPAGAVGVALGAHYRDDEIEDTPGEITLADNAWGSSGAGITAGSDTTQAIFGEAVIPLLADLPAVQSLTATVSGRYTDVKSYGSGETYKVGLNWAVNDQFRFRATNGTSFRTPALFELYLADQTSFAGQRNVDPCINWESNQDAGLITDRVANNCAADGVPGDHGGSGGSATVVTGGGLGVLEAETSEASTVGFVFTPRGVDLRMAIDYFEITVEDQVDQLGEGAIVNGCYSSEFFPDEPLCDLFTRNPSTGEGANLIDTVTDSFINVNEQTNRGIDLNVDYFHDFGAFDLLLSGRFSYQLEDTVSLLGGDERDDNGEAGSPKLVGDIGATFTRGDWSLYYGIDYIGETSNVDSFGDQSQTYLGDPAVYKLETEATIYHNVSVNRDLGSVSLRLGLSNVFDEHPPAVSGPSGEYSRVGYSAFYSQYDWLGRRAFINVTKTF